MLDSLDKPTQDAFLDFYFGELKTLGLTALIDVKLKPEQTAALVKKYRDQIDGVEVDNELLIFGINDNEVAGWKETYKQVKAVAPDMPVHFTGQTNTGAFDRLTKLGVPFDRIGLHSYMDSLDSIPSSRDYALAFSDYGSEIGKPPVITEWNWRFLTRMTPEDRAKIYPPIFENVFAARSCPVFYQFQFNESLAMASHTLRGIRHYDLVALSRRPRPEAIHLVELIQKYGDPAAPRYSTPITGRGSRKSGQSTLRSGATAPGQPFGQRSASQTHRRIIARREHEHRRRPWPSRSPSHPAHPPRLRPSCREAISRRILSCIRSLRFAGEGMRGFLCVGSEIRRPGPVNR